MPEKKSHRMQRFALKVTRWIGSPQSIFLHTVIFALFIELLFMGLFSFDALLLVFNTAVSLEAIYLALFIQMTVNYQGESLQEVEEDIGEIQEDIDEMQEDVEEIQENVDEIQEDVVELQPRLSGMPEAGPAQGEGDVLADIRADLARLLLEVESLRQK